jgi:outer membrane murein-binding lipoprotein Lpp
MMRKLMLLGAGAVGYVLGAKAGRERYDQIATQAQKLRTNPSVQKKVDEAKHAAKDAADTAVHKAREQAEGGSSAPSGTNSTATSTPSGATGPRSFGSGSGGA